MSKGNPNSNFPNAQKPAVKPAEMSGTVAAIEELRELPKVNSNDPEELENRIQHFFAWCVEKQLRPGVELLALALGTTRQSLWNWEHEGGARGEIIGRAKQVLAALLEQWSLCGKLNPVTSCFLFKNHWNYKDQFSITTAQPNNIPTKEEIIKSIPQIAKGEIVPDTDIIIDET